VLPANAEATFAESAAKLVHLDNKERCKWYLAAAYAAMHLLWQSGPGEAGQLGYKPLIDLGKRASSELWILSDEVMPAPGRAKARLVARVFAA
jgi:hypothetical protein